VAVIPSNTKDARRSSRRGEPAARGQPRAAVPTRAVIFEIKRVERMVLLLA
jgi:hypothetical protein